MILDEQIVYELVSSVDEGFLMKLAVVVQQARGKLSQREFSEMLGVSQSTVQQWENGKNVPSLENLEKIARRSGMLVEDLVAYLYGRTGGVTSKDILDRVEVMPSRDFAQVMRVMAGRLDTARDAPPVVKKGKASTKLSHQERSKEEEEEGLGDRLAHGVPLELGERVEVGDLETNETDGGDH